MAEYVATTGLTNDATGARFEQDATVHDGDFGPEVIANWVAIGVLVEKKQGSQGAGEQGTEPVPDKAARPRRSVKRQTSQVESDVTEKDAS